MQRQQLSVFVILTILFLAPASAHAIKIEEAQRAYQERYYMVFGSYVSWPPKIDGTPAPAYPDDGFYDDDLLNTTKAAQLVRDLASKLKDNGFLNKFVARDDGNIEGLAYVPVYSTTNGMPAVTEITSRNYVERFSILLEYLCKLKHISLSTQQVDIVGESTVPWPYTGTVTPEAAIDCIRIHHQEASLGQNRVYQLHLCGLESPSVPIYSGAREERTTFYDINSWPPCNRILYAAALRQTRVKVQADLTRYSGSGKCYLSVSPQPNGVAHNPPQPADGLYRLFENVTTGTIWKSPLIGSETRIDFVEETFPDPLPPCGSASIIVGWSLGQAVVVTPDFTHNVSNCAEECKTCYGGSCSAGSGSLDTGGSAQASFNLGSGADGNSAGQLALDIHRPSAVSATPNILGTVGTEGESEIIRTSEGVLRQVLAPQALADIIVANEFRYDIQFYTRDQVGSEPDPVTGLYPVSGSPYTTWTVENPSGSPDNVDTLRVTETTATGSAVNDYVWSGENLETLELSTGGGLRRESRSSVLDAITNDRVETVIVMNSDGAVVSKQVTTFHVFAWGEEPIQQIVDPDGATLTTTWSYYEDSDAYGYKQVSEVIQSTGYWERYEYDQYGRTIKVVAQYLDAPPGALESDSRVTTTTYGSGDPAVTVVETLLGQEISRRYTRYCGETQEIQAQTPGAAWDDPSNLVAITKTYLGTEFEGDIQSLKNPDGTMSLYTYSVDVDGNKTTTVKTGQPNAEETDIVDGTTTITVTDPTGNPLSETTSDIVSGLLLNSSITTEQDEFGRPTRIDYLDGTFTTTTYSCCGIDSQTDREGITTTYTHDALKRVASSTRVGITTLTSYDAESHALTTTRQGSDNSQIITNTSTYDVAGRLTSSKDTLHQTTTYTETIDAEGHTVRTTTLPNDSTRIETLAKDGSLLSLSGTAAYPLKYEYGIEPDGPFMKEIRLGPNGEETEWTKTFTDLLGRSYKTVQADGSTTQSFFNSQGQLIKQTDPDGVTTLFQYNAKGELEYTAIDMDRNGLIDFTGTDRIIRTQNDVVTAHDTTVRRTTTTVWTTDGSDATSTVAINETSADGLQSWTTTVGLTTHIQTAYDHVGGRTITVTNPDGSSAVSQYQDGRLMSVTQSASDGQQIGGTTYGYDPHGRQDMITDVRTGTTTLAYNDGDQLTSITTPEPDANQPAQTTSFEYDSLGRRIKTVLPDDGEVSYEYFDTGELKKTFGARTYTAEYTYDAQGRLQTLLAGTGTTTWNYDPVRGFLSSKLYADAMGPSYTYTSAGRLQTRTWARGIATTYDYTNAGDLASIDYADTTPDVGYTYDRRGRRTTTSDGTETLTLTYNDAGQPLTETHVGGPLDDVSLTNTYDSFLRRQTLQMAQASPLTSAAFIYDAASRLASVSDDTHSAAYAYVPNASLIESITFTTAGNPVLTTTKSYDNLNRLTAITSVPSADTARTFAYSYNDANQRTRVDLADGSYWLYEYDSLGQAISSKKYWADNTPVAGQQFDYTFDGIGNRTDTNTNSRPASYTANTLNQYTDRTVPDAVDILGMAATEAAVTVNNQDVTRTGEYFHTELAIDNSTGPAYAAVNVVGVVNNAGPGGEDVVTEEVGNVFLPQSPELYAYDGDGNLTSDGRWTYTWDAENRLIAMESMPTVPDATKRKLEFTYDYQGRRIQKKVYIWDPSTMDYGLSTDTKYLYDGWNTLAELDENGTLLRSYLWGLDLSGTLQGAGGVGGLLLTSSLEPSASSFVVYDGNGNVTALVDATTGTLSAEYDYGPFGEPIRATGSAAAANPFRFSSEYQDQETGLLYYGYRYLNTSTGKWLSRDPLGVRGDKNLYNFVGSNPLNFVDRFGLNLYAIDGTGNDPGSSSNVFQFFVRYLDGMPYYYAGVGNPSTGVPVLGLTSGAGAAGIVGTVLQQICDDYRKDKNVKIDIVGFSRGAAIANQIATELDRNGCQCKVDAPKSPRTIYKPEYPKVRFLGLFDAVYSFPLPVAWAWNDTTIPSNVQNAAHANAADETRKFFRPSMLQPSSAHTRFNQEWFKGRHSDVGGHIELNRILGAIALRWMINQAVAADVKMNTRGLITDEQISRLGPINPGQTEGFFYGGGFWEDDWFNDESRY